jgi:hypothetical protein
MLPDPDPVKLIRSEPNLGTLKELNSGLISRYSSKAGARIFD